MLTLARQRQSDNEEVLGLSELNTPAHISAPGMTKLKAAIIYISLSFSDRAASIVLK